MRIIDVMTKNVITVKKKTPVVTAQKLMKEHKIRRLPVVNDNGEPIGIVTQERLETLKPKSGTPVLWQINYLVAHTTVGDVMRKEVQTITPNDSVEHAVSKAQANKVGTLIVVDKGKIVGITTTNDIFYGIVNPLLGLGEKGFRIIIIGGGETTPAAEVLGFLKEKGIKTRVIWGMTDPSIKKKNLILHLETNDPAPIVGELIKKGYDARVIER